MEWVCIFYIFGDDIQFRECTKRLVREMKINKDGNPTVPVDGKDKDLYHLLPSGSSESLLKVRIDTITTILQKFYQYIEILESSITCPYQATAVMATIHLRDGGDLTLIVGEGEDKTQYVVCRRTICGVCKSWNAMFTKFSEAFAPEVELPDDNPQAILILLQIAHLRFDQLPGGAMSLQELNRLAIVCDKYDAVATVRPFIKTWSPASRRVFSPHGNEQYLWVYWVFGYMPEFSYLAVEMQLSICTNEDGQCLTEGGAVLDEKMPPNLIGKL
ncbi:hypothetical protein EG327_003455 [Venturia inaequalis]|uniref:BTB domain-containing protein n=1 Tax=Venturia inaequalis TaxID=5025 RepID=A0A8H3ZDF7_VENIN|nr:hypothetical protein EG327_003455 [Venturia inaequalis]